MKERNFPVSEKGGMNDIHSRHIPCPVEGQLLIAQSN
jgi:hypothetical protein